MIFLGICTVVLLVLIAHDTAVSRTNTRRAAETLSQILDVLRRGE